MNYRELKESADYLFEKEKVVFQNHLNEYCNKFASNNFRFEYSFNSKKNSKYSNKIDFDVVIEVYPCNLSKNEAIKAYEYRSYKFTLLTYKSSNQNQVNFSKRSNILLKLVLICQLAISKKHKLIKENVFDLIFKLFFKNNVYRFPNEVKGKNIELLRFIIIDVLPILFISALIIGFILNNPDGSFWSLI